MNKQKLFLLFLLFFHVFSFNAQTKKTSFLVSGKCGMCKDRIENALDVKGVVFASWSETTLLCDVTFKTNKISEKKIHELLAFKGHDTPLCRASDEAYDKLHPCCHYERKDTLK